ncbi:hypothetical protein E6C67_14360 [Azospirillum sp. TSA2s]|uniref:hypothetical protein n=1 Tax=Azospirillum sp. TSA2s TaxID=709810 RepID=UPI0010AB0245|nr:hypothetical protein [Azospirillum sp. TSA2s]QCG95009.1 hypothetical protein E6C67_14360 [Azospirillum sp. TSA2s]
MSSNPFNCPPQVYRSMMDRATPTHMPALWAARTLGPLRVQYAGRPYRKMGDRTISGLSIDDTPTSWSLDGRKHVTVGELIAAAEAVAYPAAA